MRNGLVDFNAVKPELASAVMDGYNQGQKNRLAAEQDRIANQQAAFNLSNAQQRAPLVQQELQNRTETSNLELQRLKEERDQLTQLRAKLATVGQTPEELFGALATHGTPEQMVHGRQGLMKLEEQKKFAQLLGTGDTAPTFGTISKLQQFGATVTDPDVHRQVQNAIDTNRQLLTSRTASPNRFVPVGKNIWDNELQDYRLAPQERVAGTLGTGGASVTKPMTVVQNQKAVKDEAASLAAVEMMASQIANLNDLKDKLIGNPDRKMQPHPGLYGVTGLAGALGGVTSMIPSMTGNDPDSARSAAQILETYKGSVAAMGRDIQSLSGKLGNMAVKEWEIVQSTIQKLDPRAGNFAEQLADVDRRMAKILEIAKNKHARTYAGADSSMSSFGASGDQRIMSTVDQIPQGMGGGGQQSPQRGGRGAPVVPADVLNNARGGATQGRKGAPPTVSNW